jgi:hypothetical protein
MLRKTLVAATAAAVLGVAALAPTSALAGPHGFHGGFHGFHGGHGFGIGFGIATLGVATYAATCWQDQLVLTPRGYYKHVLVNVCQ